MKITYRDFQGMEDTMEFKDVAEFIMLEQREVPPLEDNFAILSLEIDGQKQDFKGSVIDLFNQLNA